MSEDQIQIEFAKWCETQSHIKFSMIPADVFIQSFNQRNRLIWMGYRRGVPDMLLCVYDKLCFIEFKTDKGKVSEHQQKWIDRLRACNVEVFVCRSVQEAIDSIENMK